MNGKDPQSKPAMLLTAFDPFDGSSLNASKEALELLPDMLHGRAISKLLLPTSFTHAWPVLRSRIEETAPSTVILLGEAQGRSRISVERSARNLIQARIPDNDGLCPTDEPVIIGAPPLYDTRVPWSRCVSAILQSGVPGEISHDAGHFVCNATLFWLLHFVAADQRGTSIQHAGFLHLPWLPEQRAVKADPSIPVMTKQDAARGVLAVLTLCAREGPA